MKHPLGKLRVALVFLFVTLAVSFMAAQKPLNSDGNLVPNGKHQGVPAAAAQPGPIGQTVVTGNGINYHGGPVLKSNP
ncbi:MAG: hypothetical protein ACRD4I_11690, partial [Candidatus Angelobacter sp.]